MYKLILKESSLQIFSFLAAFFQATQFFFTLCFIGMLVAIVFIVMYLLCINEYYRVSVLRWTGIDLIVSGALGTIALIIFGVKGEISSSFFCPSVFGDMRATKSITQTDDILGIYDCKFMEYSGKIVS